jgi:hypothetical protein
MPVRAHHQVNTRCAGRAGGHPVLTVLAVLAVLQASDIAAAQLHARVGLDLIHG